MGGREGYPVGLSDFEELLVGENEDLRRQLAEAKDELGDELATLRRQLAAVERENERLREAAEPFLSLQSPDHTGRVAGLIHGEYFRRLRAALDCDQESSAAIRAGEEPK
jgi:hypothetical protein